LTNQGYEIDFLAAGEESKSGDAIALRFGNLKGDRSDQFIMVIDGGSKADGEKLVEHIQKYYKTDYVNAVLLTHPDADHASGFTEVLNNLKVDYLLMHLPWEHSEELRGLFRDGRVTPNSLKEALERSLNNAYELHQIAIKKGITIIEPFSDNPILSDYLTVLSPSTGFYSGMVANFRETPDPIQELLLSSLMRKAVAAAKEAVKTVLEGWNIETLSDPDEGTTSAENNTSVILLLDCCGQKLLFTGDAGVPALTEAAEKAEELGIDLSNLSFIQIPHHGSKRNVGPTILNRIVGPKLSVDLMSKVAFVSAAKEGEPKHPAKKVTNAFRRRGCKVCATVGQSICNFHNSPLRTGWTTVEPLPFYDVVEE
jgi:beta-lactamase superfamily II metal-dependent hydrolase